jgi:tetratricopeptide (TPR) repeat protein
VEIDPALAEGHAALGQAIMCRDFAWASAEHELVRAIELDPNYAQARIWYALQLAMEGRFSESLREAHIARDLDPMAIMSRFSVVWCSYHARRFDEAYRLARATLDNEPTNLMMLYALSFCANALGKHDEAIEAAQKTVNLMGKASHTLGRLGSAHAAAGNVKEADDVLHEMQQLEARRYVSPYHVAHINGVLGRVEATLDALERAYELNDGKLLWLQLIPRWTVSMGILGSTTSCANSIIDWLHFRPLQLSCVPIRSRLRCYHCACSALLVTIPATSI